MSDPGRPADLQSWLQTHRLHHAYTYSYPHKTAYRPLSPRPLEEVWADEARGSLYLYFHVPFCESRCGYCNLFSHARVSEQRLERYLDTLARQVDAVCSALTPLRFACVGFGGGTPTCLSPAQLERLFELAELRLGASLAELPVSLETSPATASAEHLALICQRGVDRLSIGVQSFQEQELTTLGRRQPADLSRAVLDRVRQLTFPILNIDLIYGVPGQTVESWLATIEEALTWRPEELYLYPLYVRPLTELSRRARQSDELSLACYHAGLELLMARGYQQLSMRLFRHDMARPFAGPVYSCQEDGMVGLGCGARSYTRALHYSDEWAVGSSGVHQILDRWIASTREDLGLVRHGFQLDTDDRRRRYLLKSLLRVEGIDLQRYQELHGGALLDHLPELGQLQELGYAVLREGRLTLTARGLERSDTIGPWLYSRRVREAMAGYRLV